jgi:hypothetical protein
LIDFSSQKAFVNDKKKQLRAFDIIPRFTNDKIFYTKSFNIEFEDPIEN